MCEQLMPLDELRKIKFSVSSLAELIDENGSYNQENARNIAKGIRARIDWVIEKLEPKDD